ncbi:hypothetical protein JHK86_021669 [Glycine max]|nr:hypothetical protein JHK86_021669 [Glycine max]
MCEIALKFWTTEGEEKEAAKEEFLECLKLFEEQLGDKPYFGGDNLGLLDVALVPLICYFYTYNLYGNFINEDKYPKFIAWAKRCTQKESVSKCFPEEHRVKEFISKKKKNLNSE